MEKKSQKQKMGLYTSKKSENEYEIYKNGKLVKPKNTSDLQVIIDKYLKPLGRI